MTIETTHQQEPMHSYKAKDGTAFAFEYQCIAYNAELRRDELQPYIEAMPQTAYNPPCGDKNEEYTWYLVPNRAHLDMLVAYYNADNATIHCDYEDGEEMSAAYIADGLSFPAILGFAFSCGNTGYFGTLEDYENEASLMSRQIRHYLAPPEPKIRENIALIAIAVGYHKAQNLPLPYDDEQGATAEAAYIVELAEKFELEHGAAATAEEDYFTYLDAFIEQELAKVPPQPSQPEWTVTA